jgi:hypothetical protein
MRKTIAPDTVTAHAQVKVLSETRILDANLFILIIHHLQLKASSMGLIQSHTITVEK